MKKERLWTPVFTMLLCIGFFAMVGGGGVNAGASIYLNHIGEGPGLAGIGALMFSGASAVARLAAGPIIDQRGRGVVMIAGSCLAIVGTLLPVIDSTGAFFIIGRLVQGFGIASAVTSAATAVADVLPMTRLGEGIGYFGMGQALSIAVGPAIAIALANSEYPVALYYGMGFFAVIAFVLSMLSHYEKHPERLPETSAYRIRWEKGEIGRKEGGPDEPYPSPEEAVKLKDEAESQEHEPWIKRWFKSAFEVKALRGAIPFMVIAPMFGFSSFFMGLYGISVGVGNTGVYYVVVSLSMVAVRLVSGRFMDTTAPIKLMAVTVAFGLICFVMSISCSFVEDPFAREIIFYTMGIPNGISSGLSTPLCQSVSIKASPPDRWGAATGVFYFAFDVGIGLGSMIFGIMCESVGYVPTLVSVLCCIAASFPVAYLCFPKTAGQVEAEAELQ